MHNRQNYFLEINRLIASLFVVSIHVQLPGVAGELIAAVARYAVPFFVLISGYYLCDFGKTKEENLQRAKKALRKAFLLALAVTVLYASINVAKGIILKKGAFTWLTDRFNLEDILLLLLANRAWWITSIAYYLYGMIYVYIIYIWALRKNLVKIFEWALIPLLLCNLLIIFVLKKDWYYAGNWCFTFLPFFFLGIFLARHKKIFITGEKRWCYLTGMILGICTIIVERTFLGAAYCSIGVIITAVSVFLLSQTVDIHSEGLKKLSFWAGSCSLYIFILHCAVRDFLMFFVANNELMVRWSFFIVAVISAGLGTMILWLTEKKRKIKE